MSDVASKLIADLKWRLSAAGKKFRPKDKEVKSWGAFRVPKAVPWLVWLAYCILITAGVDSFSWLRFEEFPGIILGGPVGMIWSAFLVNFVTRKVNSSAAVKAYQELLSTRERFSLVEYSRYLQRQIKRASADSTIGGANEMKRLMDIDRKLRKLLREGAGQDGLPITSELSEEAELAQAVVETYGELQSDPLEKLDSRLPDDILASLGNLEKEESEN